MDLEIKESIAELESLMAKENDCEFRDRLRLLYLLKTEQVTEVKQVAQKLKKDETTLSRWIAKYRTGGLVELLNNKRKHNKYGAIEELLWQQLQQPGIFSSYLDIQHWLLQEHGISLHLRAIYRIVRYKLKIQPVFIKSKKNHYTKENNACK